MLRRCLVVRSSTAVSIERLIYVDKLCRLRHDLETARITALTRTEYNNKCASFGLTPEESKRALEAFAAAGVVVLGSEQTIVTDVRKALEVFHEAIGQRQPCLSAKLMDERDQVAKELEAQNIVKAEVDRSVATWWSKFWSAVAVASGTQMLVLCYLTFVVLDWDAMEPVCYFLTTATALVFFGFMLKYKREHGLQVWDECVLPEKVEELYAHSNFDIRRWLALNQELSRLDKEIEMAKAR
eukprot:PhM_4_TR5747/c0_g1_i1/m.103667/K20858/MCU; calcium uniporter protein, mitochondrial